jgi:hypothetical protein
MEYVITTERSFGEIETLTKHALERHGFSVQRTFSLQSATGAAGGQEQPGYSVFLLCRSGTDRRPLGLLTLYRRGAQTVINPMLSLVADADVEAELIGALVLGDLGICIDAGGAERCIDLARTEEELRPDVGCSA